MNTPITAHSPKESSNGDKNSAPAFTGAAISPFFDQTWKMAKVSSNEEKGSTNVTPTFFPSPFLNNVPSGITHDSVANDNKNGNTNASCEAGRSMSEKKETAPTKRKLARVSLDKSDLTGDGLIKTTKGSQLGGSLSSSDSDNDSDDEPTRKKQKTDLETQEEGLETENSHEGSDDTPEECSGDEIDGPTDATNERAQAVETKYLEDESESPYNDAIRKLKEWTDELLSITKELEDARVSEQ